MEAQLNSKKTRFAKLQDKGEKLTEEKAPELEEGMPNFRMDFLVIPPPIIEPTRS